MKKCLCIVLGIVLLAAGIAAGCFCCRPPKPAPPEEPEEPSPPDVVLGAGEWTFSFEEDFLMFPTLRGSLVFEEYPDKLTFSYNGEEREIEIADAEFKQYFVLEFEQTLFIRTDSGRARRPRRSMPTSGAKSPSSARRKSFPNTITI